MKLYYLTPVLLSLSAYATPTTSRKTCVVKSSGTNSTDDAPAIRAAFAECGQHGEIIFAPITYYVNTALNVRDLEDVDIDVQGQLLVSHLEISL